MVDPLLNEFTPAEHANFLAARAVALATSFLDGRSDAEKLFSDANALQGELILGWSGVADVTINLILEPVRLLVFSMQRAALAQGEARQARWRDAMTLLVELVRHESFELKKSGAQRS